jgi:cytochrome c peroxidase
MDLKIKSIVLVLLLLAPAGPALADDGPRSEPMTRDSYRRPAEIPFPETDPFSAAKVELGKKLFFDPILSGSGSTSCATCHNPGLSWGDGRPRARGEGPSPLALRSPTMLNMAWLPRYGWDGKFRDLESVGFVPLLSPMNMNLPVADLISRLEANPGYKQAFTDIFPDGITRRTIEEALATFERTIVSDQAPFDLWVEGDEQAISDPAKRGFALFTGKARCSGCHNTWAFTDGSFHDIGTAERNDIGRGRIFQTSVKLQYAFKTPTLRDVARRAPYMHDGSIPTLEAVIDLYDRGGIARPSRSELISPLALTSEEKADLVEFLKTLTSEPKTFQMPILPR